MIRVLLVAIAMSAVPIGEARADRVRQEAAIATFERGQAQFRQGRYDAAAGLFKEAFETWPDPAYLYNIGYSFEKAQRWPLAVLWYRRFMARYGDSPNAPEVARRLAAAERSREADRAEVMITSEPAGARAELLVGRVDSGEFGDADEAPPSCVTPCLLRVDPGPVAIAVELAARRVERTRSLAARERWDLAVELPGFERRSPDRTPSWVAWGIAGASLALGIGFAVAAQDSFDEGEALAARGPLGDADQRRLAGLRAEVSERSLVADLGFAGALVGAGVGAILWATAEDEVVAVPAEAHSWR